MRVRAVGLRSGTDATANTARAMAAVAAAGEDGTDLVVLPEYASRFDPRGVGPEHAQPLAEGFVAAMRGAARAASSVVIVGTTIPGERPDRAVNAVVAIDGGGELVGTYRKVHLYDAFGQRESDRLEAGPADAAPLVLPVGDLTVGVMTCYDLRFPEAARRLVDAGADVLVVPAAWAAGEHKADQWLTLLRARAIENAAYVIGAALRGRGLVGDTCVVDPMGVILATTGAPSAAGQGGPAIAGESLVAADPRPRDAGESLVAADLDASVVATVRERNPSLANRRYRVVPLE